MVASFPKALGFQQIRAPISSGQRTIFPHECEGRCSVPETAALSLFRSPVPAAACTGPRGIALVRMESPSRESAEAPGSALIFGNFRLVAGGSLFRGETRLEITPAELAVLRLLLTHPGQIVSAAQVREAMGSASSPARAVPACIESLRASLGPEDLIETVYKRGYRLRAGVRPYRSGLLSAEPGSPFAPLPAPILVPSLAIVPFSAAAGTPEYLAWALADETAAHLAQARPISFRIAASQSVATLAGRGLSAQQIGAAMGASLALTGKVWASPTHFRVRLQMIQVAGDRELWSEDLLIELGQVPQLSRRLAARIQSRLEASITISAGTGGEPVLEPPSVAPPAVESVRRTPEGSSKTILEQDESWELLARARSEWRSLERHQMQDALQRLTRAADLDPTLAEARIELANLCVAQALHGYLQPGTAAQMVHRAAQRFLDSEDRTQSAATGAANLLPAAILPALGWVHFYADRDLPAALQAFEGSAHLPHDSRVTSARTLFPLSRRRFTEAIDLLSAALRLDPWSALLHARMAWALHLAGEAAASVKQAEYALAEFPDDESPALIGALVLAANGQAGQAVKIARELARQRPYFDAASGVLAHALVCGGHPEEAREILERLEWLSRERYVMSTFNAAAWVALDEPEAAIQQLRAAEQARCPWFFQMMADPRLAALHAHPEFQAMEAILAGMEATAVNR